jgi:phosphomannomutase
MVERLKKLRGEITIGVVGGSDLVKQKEQLGENGAFPLSP